MPPPRPAGRAGARRTGAALRGRGSFPYRDCRARASATLEVIEGLVQVGHRDHLDVLRNLAGLPQVRPRQDEDVGAGPFGRQDLEAYPSDGPPTRPLWMLTSKGKLGTETMPITGRPSSRRTVRSSTVRGCPDPSMASTVTSRVAPTPASSISDPSPSTSDTGSPSTAVISSPGNSRPAAGAPGDVAYIRAPGPCSRG